MSALRLTIISDIHQASNVYEETAGAIPPIPGVELLKRVARRIKAEDNCDALIIAGDILNNGSSADADDNYKALLDMAESAGVPVIAIPGNHDGDPRRMLSVFGEYSGAHELPHAVIYSFVDRYAEGDFCARDENSLAELVEYAAAHPGKPIIAVQHNPVWPPIESDYPYNLTNSDMVMRAYDNSGVALSISGHYHAGQSTTKSGSTSYTTAPALCEPPFKYMRVIIEDGKVETLVESLKNSEGLELFDGHIHSEYAYCGHGIDARTAIERARLFGLTRMSLTEHSDQLYLTEADFRAKKIFEDPGLPRRTRDAGLSRMDDYKQFAAGFRSDFVRLGLEVECDCEFQPILLEEDVEGWDVILAGIHWITDAMISRADGVDQAFMRMVDSLLGCGAEILAHPFRFYHSGGMDRPKHLYKPLARTLRDRNVAAEVNFHTNTPDPEFFATCLDEGVKIAFGSDSHAPYEVGELGLHLNLLRSIDVTDADLPSILYRLP